ncbi:MAG: hypothetical protein RL642_785 [Bacteroidota bacterium]
MFPVKRIDTLHANASYIIHLQKVDKKGTVYNRHIAVVYRLNERKLIKLSKAFIFIPTQYKDIESGNILLTNTHPQSISTPFNPGSFDFASFANNKNIFLSCFLNKEHDFIKIGDKKNKLTTFLNQCRTWIIATLQKQIGSPKEAGLAEALLIGYKEDLDEELQAQYTLSGISHIIAVSGMHLGLIFSVLSYLLSLITKRKILRLFSFGIILPLLWTFALITGASASVLRSVLVFSFVLFGNLLLKRSTSINVLLASAFFLLVLQPTLLYDIGFQLSYAAVLSILIYEPLISKLVYTKNKLIKYLWEMVSITLAAQILTTPIILYHFNQFPLFFLITNMVAVPLSSLVLLLTILLCLMSALAFPSSLLIDSMLILIKMMNNYVAKIASIPNNTVHLQTSIAFTSGMFISIAVITYAFTHKHSNMRLMIVSSILFLSLLYQFDYFKLRWRNQVIVLNIKNATAIVHQHGKRGHLLVSNNYLTNSYFTEKHLLQVSKALGISNWKVSELKQSPAMVGIMDYKSKKKLIVFTGFSQSGTPLTHLIPESERSAELIADKSNSLWKIREWEKQAQELHLRLHSTPTKGAFQTNCN